MSKKPNLAYYTLGSRSEPEGLTLVVQQEDSDGNLVGGYDPDKLYKKKKITKAQYDKLNAELKDSSSPRGTFGLVNKAGEKAFQDQKKNYDKECLIVMIIKHQYALEELSDMADDGVKTDKVLRRAQGRGIHPDVMSYVLDNGYQNAVDTATLFLETGKL